MLTGVGVSCRLSYSFVSHLYASFSGSITYVRDESAIFCCSFLARLWFTFGGFHLLVLEIGCGFSSPEPSGSQGELIVYPCPGVRRRCRRCK